jgi:hypothetical protein
MALSGMSGLSVFISDVRDCQNKEQERLRVGRSSQNIRTCFKNERVCLALFTTIITAHLRTPVTVESMSSLFALRDR